MPDAPKNTVPRQSQKTLSWWQKILLAVFGAYLAEKLFGILIPSLPHASIPSTPRETASTDNAYDDELPYRREYEEDEEYLSSEAAPRTAGNTAKTRTSSTMTGTTTARGMTTIISTTETLSRVRCVSVSAYAKGVFLCPQRQQMILRRAAIVSPTS